MYPDASAANVVSYVSLSAMAMWYPDLGAIIHVTHSGENIARYYQTNKSILEILTTNGKPMKVKNEGSSIRKNNSLTLKLNNILLVLEASKNLLSIHKFFVDNKVMDESDYQSVRIQDWMTRKLLAKGFEKNGLYQLPLQMSKVADTTLLGEQSSTDV